MSHELLVNPEPRLVLVNGDLLLDDVLLQVEVLLPQRRANQVAEQVHHPLLELRQHRRVVDGVFLAGGRVVVRTISSNSRLTSAALRRSLPLNIMCSRKWLTPEIGGVSSREPVRTKNPAAIDAAAGLTSATTFKPLSRTALLNSIYHQVR